MIMIFMALVGCSTDAPAPAPTPEPAPAQELTPEQHAVQIARAIDAKPDAAEAALKEHGMSEQQYRDLLYAIAEDPAKAKTFQAERAAQ